MVRGRVECLNVRCYCMTEHTEHIIFNLNPVFLISKFKPCIESISIWVSTTLINNSQK